MLGQHAPLTCRRLLIRIPVFDNAEELRMFELFGRVKRDEKAIKAIFDHYKNFGVAALIVAIGVRMFNRSSDGLFFWWSPTVIGSLLVMIGLILVALNERHAMYMLDQAGLTKMQHLLILVVYGMTTIGLIFELAFGSYASGS